MRSGTLVSSSDFEIDGIEMALDVSCTEEMDHFDRTGEPVRNLLNAVFIQRHSFAAI